MEEQNEREYEENGLASYFQDLIKFARWNYVGTLKKIEERRISKRRADYR